MTPTTVGGLAAEERVRVAAELVAQSPPGEFGDVLHDVRGILGNDDLLAGLHASVRQRNLQNGVAVTATLADGDQTAVMLTEFNELADGRFLDPNSGTILAVNHFNLVKPRTAAASSHAKDVEEVLEDGVPRAEDVLRSELKRAAKAYLRETLPAGRSEVYCSREGEESKKSDSLSYALVMVGERFQNHNMRNGQWRSVWRYIPDEGRVQGEVCVLVHYFEDGNVQLNTHKKCDLALDVSQCAGEPRAIADRLIVLLRAKEDEIQLALNEAYAQLSETTFKRLRRQLPVTRSKVDWGKLATYRVTDQLPK